jgi:hypothetical protein
METPGNRCKDSETFWSGILPMSSGTIDSMGCSDWRLASNADCNEARKPVTTTSWSSDGVAGGCDVLEGCASCAPAEAHKKIAGNDVAVTIAVRAA